VTGQGPATIIQTVFPQQGVFDLDQEDRVSSMFFRLVPGVAAIYQDTTVVLGVNNTIDNIICEGGSNGGGGSQPDCVFMFGGPAFIMSNVNSHSWDLSDGFATGGDPPDIECNTKAGALYGAVSINNLVMNDEGGQIENTGSYLLFSNCGGSLTGGYIGGSQGVNFSYGNTGIRFEGASQALYVSGTAVTGFSDDVVMATSGGNSPLTLDISASHFDFCSQVCLSLEGGGWVSLVGDSFVGEGGSPNEFAGNTGILMASGFTGPNTIVGDTVNGFSGSGSYGMQFNGNANTTVGANQFTNNSTNISGSLGSNSALGQNCSGSPSGSFSSFNGIVGHC